MSELENKSAEISEEETTRNPELKKQFKNYLTSYVNKLGLSSVDIDRETKKVSDYIDILNETADVFASSEYRKIVDKEQEELRGSCSIASSFCIDGRIFILAIGGSVITFSKTKAGILEVDKNVFANLRNRIQSTEESIRETEETTEEKDLVLKDKRIVEALISKAKEGKETLYIPLAHTSNKTDIDPNVQDCGAMNELQNQGKIEEYKKKGIIPDETTLLQANFALYGRQIKAVENIFNNTAAAAGKTKLKRIGINGGVYNTDTMGITFYGEKRQPSTGEKLELSTVKIIKNIYEKMQDVFREQENEILSTPGVISNFADLKGALSLEKMIYSVTKVIMKLPEFKAQIKDFLDLELDGFTEGQKQAFSFYIARNTAFQYVTGLFQESHPHHSMQHHDENFQSISLNGESAGQFLESQAFSPTIGTIEDAISHIKTQVGLMNKHGKTKPHVVFLSKPVSKEELNTNGGGLERSKASLRKNYESLLANEKIIELIAKGEILIVPTVIIDKTREIVEIVDLAAA